MNLVPTNSLPTANAPAAGRGAVLESQETRSPGGPGGVLLQHRMRSLPFGGAGGTAHLAWRSSPGRQARTQPSGRYEHAPALTNSGGRAQRPPVDRTDQHAPLPWGTVRQVFGPAREKTLLGKAGPKTWICSVCRTEQTGFVCATCGWW